jgi:hypothetical protein
MLLSADRRQKIDRIDAQHSPIATLRRRGGRAQNLPRGGTHEYLPAARGDLHELGNVFQVEIGIAWRDDDFSTLVDAFVNSARTVGVD